MGYRPDYKLSAEYTPSNAEEAGYFMAGGGNGDSAGDSRGNRGGDFSIFWLWFSVVGLGGPMIILAAIHSELTQH